MIRRVTEHGAYSNLALRGQIRRARLGHQDADLVTELVYGTLRRLPAIDHALAPLLRKPLTKAPPTARAALRLGAYQLLHTRVPDHAAVSETVALVGASERGFVNAVLRRLAASGPRAVTGGAIDRLAIRSGLAPWAVRELRRQLGDQAEEAAMAFASPAPTTIRLNPCRSDASEIERRLGDAGISFERGRLHERTLRLASGVAPQRVPGFDDGWMTAQDESSAWVVDVLDPQPGERVADLCAGPGGKASDIACRAGGVLAADAGEGRVRLVAETVERLGVSARLLVQDAARPALRPGSFDRVLVDAPCSGIGAARRRPELLWRPRREDVPALARLQTRILVGAAALLRPGGVLVYSVCTFPAAETDAVCEALLRRVPELRPDPFDGPDGPAARARLWPHRHGTDGMFVARFAHRGA